MYMYGIWYIYTMEHFSAIKRNKIMPFTATWMDLEIFVLSGIDKKYTERKDKDKYVISLICGI